MYAYEDDPSHQKSVGERRPTLAHDASLAASNGSRRSPGDALRAGLNMPERGERMSKSSSEESVRSDAVLGDPASTAGTCSGLECASTEWMSEKGDCMRGLGACPSSKSRDPVRGVLYAEVDVNA